MNIDTIDPITAQATSVPQLLLGPGPQPVGLLPAPTLRRKPPLVLPSSPDIVLLPRPATPLEVLIGELFGVVCLNWQYGTPQKSYHIDGLRISASLRPGAVIAAAESFGLCGNPTISTRQQAVDALRNVDRVAAKARRERAALPRRPSRAVVGKFYAMEMAA